MATLTGERPTQIAQIASRHGVSSAAASALMAAIAAGGGRQAQFDHPELGGMGQWSHGGMIMIGDMFNQDLKARVARLCADLAELAPAALGASGPDPAGPAEASPRDRWPAELGAPSATGSQNAMHYAVFPHARRLAIEQDGRMTVYDTQDHRIGGVAQGQGSEQSLRFTSQSGEIRLADLKIVG